MSKISSLLFALLLVLSNVSALTTIYAPITRSVQTGSTFALGVAAPGHVITIIMDRGHTSDPWKRVEVTPNWLKGMEITEDRMWVTLTVPRAAEKKTYQLDFRLFGNASKEEFGTTIMVVSDTLETNTTTNVVEGRAGEPVHVPVLIINKSIGETRARISCSLPKDYCESMDIPLSPGASVLVEYPILYPVPGDHKLTIKIQDLGSLATHRHTVVLSLKNTMKNEFRLLAFALPVVEPILLPLRSILVYVP